MEDNRKEQIEALEVLSDFNKRLMQNIPIAVKELSGERLEDTDNFIKSIIDAMNWEIQVVNGTMDVLNEGRKRIEKEDFNSRIVAIADAVNSHNDAALATAFQDALPYFETLGKAAEEVTK